MIKDPEIIAAIRGNAAAVKIPRGSTLRAAPLLAAMTAPESSFGLFQYKPRFERAYFFGGIYYDRSEAVRQGVEAFERCGAMSWGACQIMFPTAHELGFNGRPWDLSVPGVHFRWVVEYLNRRTFGIWAKASRPELAAPALTLEQVGDSWNTGTHRDSIAPSPEYVSTLVEAYSETVAIF